MFGLILPSRPVLTPPLLQTISPTQFAYTFVSEPHFSHIVIFLLPGNSLPVDVGAAVYIQFPGSFEFKLLGAISMEKPSAIFRVNGIPGTGKHADGMANGIVEVDMDAEVDQIPTLNGVVAGNVVVGISIEPAASLAAQVANLKANTTPSTSTALTIARRPLTKPTTKLLAQRIIKNAFNFLASFAGGEGGNEMVPLKSFQDWWAKFERRVEVDPGFLEREEDG